MYQKPYMYMSSAWGLSGRRCQKTIIRPFQIYTLRKPTRQVLAYNSTSIAILLHTRRRSTMLFFVQGTLKRSVDTGPGLLDLP
jgi:hypothetical protein